MNFFLLYKRSSLHYPKRWAQAAGLKILLITRYTLHEAGFEIVVIQQIIICRNFDFEGIFQQLDRNHEFCPQPIGQVQYKTWTRR